MTRCPAFALMRVDDRLLHGQVVFGWGAALAPRAYVIVDDEVAADPWEREAFEDAAPEDVGVRVMTVDEFTRDAAAWTDPEGTVVLLRALATVERLVEAGVTPPAGFNLGGLHAREGSRELLPYLHLPPEDTTRLGRLLGAGVPLYAQDLPTAMRRTAAELRELIEDR